jgi:hypothetical protein
MAKQEVLQQPLKLSYPIYYSKYVNTIYIILSGGDAINSVFINASLSSLPNNNSIHLTFGWWGPEWQLGIGTSEN